MSSFPEQVTPWFEAASPLGAVLDGFSPRPEQLSMARQVAQAMAGGRHLAIEAGAGTGKTLAYLVPALLSGRRVVVATGTRTLQDQLYHRDLPVLGAALGRPVRVAQLKGRANYLCHYRFERAAGQTAALPRIARRELALVSDWALRTAAGDIAEVRGVSEDSPVWPLVTSTADNCLGSRCPLVERCHVVAARRRAQDCDLAIVNHHLLLADMTLKDDGFGRLLPGADVVVVDEAHRFPETAQSLFDVMLGSRPVEESLADLADEARRAGAGGLALQSALDAVLKSLAAVAAAAPPEGEPVALTRLEAAFTLALGELADALQALAGQLEGQRELTPGLARAVERLAALALTATRVAGWESLSDLAWAQRQRQGFVVHVSPLDASSQLRTLLEAQAGTWIFTSATLAIGDDFSHFTARLGLSGLDTARIDSPFDYGRVARLLLPAGLPLPDAPDYTDRVVAATLPLLASSRGRAFLLFTSHRALQRAAELLEAGGHGHSLLVQGRAPRSRLIEDFLRLDNAVLLGTATFWEGVDIRGPRLVVVAIDKLPFASPGDPLLQARLELVRRAGGDPFRDHQLPQAVLALRQGVGRLIRGYDDYGVVMVCDPRLTSRGYGKLFLASLPPMPVLRSVAEAEAFLAAREQAA